MTLNNVSTPCLHPNQSCQPCDIPEGDCKLGGIGMTRKLSQSVSVLEGASGMITALFLTTLSLIQKEQALPQFRSCT